MRAPSSYAHAVLEDHDINAPQLEPRYLHNLPHEYGASNGSNLWDREQSHYCRPQLPPSPRSLHLDLSRKLTSDITKQHPEPQPTAAKLTAGPSKHGNPYAYKSSSVLKPRYLSATASALRHATSSPSLCGRLHHHHYPHHGTNATPGQYRNDHNRIKKSRPRGIDHSGRSAQTQPQHQPQMSPSIAVPGRRRGKAVGNGVDVQEMIRRANVMGGSVNYVTQGYLIPERRLRKR